jgi:hypothetical protein
MAERHARQVSPDNPAPAGAEFAMPSWDFLRTFRAVRPTARYTWDSFRRIKAHADKAANEILEQYRLIRGEWMPA